MFRWIVYPYHRQSIFLSLILFIITTVILYILVECYTLSEIETSSSFDLNCELTNETIRAINLAPSDYCKKKLQDISCEINSKANFFPKSLPRFCPIQKGHFGEIIGCISTTNNSTYRIDKLQIFNSDILCTDFCLKHSVSFAEYNALTGHCYCLSKFDPQDHVMIECDRNSMTIYRTGYIDSGNHLEKQRQTQNNNETILVYFLTVGGRKNLRQIKRLIRAIYSRQHYYLIHVDSREDYLYQQLVILSKKISNIYLTNKRFPTTWGSSTLLLAHLEAFKQIFEELKWKFSFILNLSESDFPLKPVQVLTNFLSNYISYNFLRSHNREPFKFIKSQGMFHTFIHCENYMYRIGSRPLIQNLVYDGGSDWYVLNREFVYYVTYGNDELINGLRHIFNYSLLPCEAFFHTVLSNSIYCDSYVRNNLRLVHWNRKRGCKCQHKSVVDWCGCSPIVYRNMDKTVLNDTIDKPLFFARKFDPTIDEQILDWLDQKISRRDFSNGAYYLQNIYNLNDNFNNIFKYLDLYARTILNEYQQYRRSCFSDDNFQLEQIHTVYQLSIFQGYSLQYKFNDGEQIEIFIKLNLLNAIRTNQVKRFEVGIELDNKEMVFTDDSRTFIEPKLVKVLIEWEYMNDNDTSLVINSPNGAVIQRVKVYPSNKPFIIDIFFPVVSSPDVIGIWQMSIIKENSENFLASLNFLVLLSNEEELLNIQYLTIIPNFWLISNTCSTRVNNFLLCENLLNQTQLININDCYRQKWSFFFFDIKSDL